MRYMRKTAFALMLTLALTGLGFESCKTTTIGIAREVVAGLNDALPIFAANGLSTTTLSEAVSIGNQVITALDSGTDSGNTLTLVSDLIGRFNLLIAESNRITNPTTRTIILVSLAVVNMALRRLADRIAEKVPPDLMRRADPRIGRIQLFRAKRNWRCRDSQTGRFAKMSHCKANPATTQVEVY